MAPARSRVSSDLYGSEEGGAPHFPPFACPPPIRLFLSSSVVVVCHRCTYVSEKGEIAKLKESRKRGEEARRRTADDAGLRGLSLRPSLPPSPRPSFSLPPSLQARTYRYLHTHTHPPRTERKVGSRCFPPARTHFRTLPTFQFPRPRWPFFKKKEKCRRASFQDSL